MAKPESDYFPGGDRSKSSSTMLLQLRKKFNEVQEEARGLRVLVDLARGISAHLDLDEILTKAMNAAVTLSGAERGYIVLLDDEGKPTVRASFHINPDDEQQDDIAFSRSVILHTVKTGEPTLSTNASDDERFADARSVQIMNLRAVMAAPITDASGKPVGAVYVDDPFTSGKFNEGALLLLQGFADQVSAAIQTARLHRNLMNEEVRRHQMELAQAVQQSLIPKEPPKIRSLEVAWAYRSALEVGGDLFSFPKMADGNRAILVADVAGKGVPAALIMTKIHEASKMSAAQTTDPVEFLKTVNRSFREDFAVGNMVTASVVQFSEDASAIRCVRAGHCPFGIVRASDKTFEWHEPQGLALGLVGDDQWTQLHRIREIPLRRGDGVLLFTDGVTEAMTQSGDEYGMERIKAYAEQNTQATAREFVDGLLADVEAFTGPARQSDDITVVYARRLRTAGPALTKRF